MPKATNPRQADSPITAALAYLRARPLEDFPASPTVGVAAPRGDRLETQVRDAVAIDIDGDGSTEVFVWVTPQYLQSPTVVVFSVSPDGEVRRLAEALAPGLVRPMAGELVDSHSMGWGADIVDAKDRDGFSKAAAEAALRESLHVVLYRRFVHTDGRRGFGSFVDLTSARVDAHTCAGLGFSQLKSISAGSLGGQRVFLAAAGDSIYVYRITKIDVRGLFTKAVTVLPLPADFVAFAESSSGQAAYRTTSGHVESVPSNQGLQPTPKTGAAEP